MSDFSLQLTKNFSRIMRIRRRNLGWSAQDLANKTEELDHPISRSLISGLENDRNKDNLRFADAIVLAEALEVPLHALLFDNERAMRALDHEPQASKELLAVTLFSTSHDQLDD